MVLLSVTGVVRMILIIVGVALLLKVIGQFLIAKRNAEAEREALRKQREEEVDLANSARNFGKTTISKIDKSNDANAGEYVDYEEIKE